MDTIETLREEVDSLQAELNRVKNDNVELSQHGRLTRLYRDEIDTLNEKLRNMEKHHQELEKYKGRCHDADLLKDRLDELQNESE